jgi:hypothetical protein
MTKRLSEVEIRREVLDYSRFLEVFHATDEQLSEIQKVLDVISIVFSHAPDTTETRRERKHWHIEEKDISNFLKSLNGENFTRSDLQTFLRVSRITATKWADEIVRRGLATRLPRDFKIHGAPYIYVLAKETNA